MRKFLICVLFLSSCSLIKPTAVRSNSLAGLELVAITDSVYKLKDQAIYLTKLEDCRSSGANSSLEAQARQLLVGFKDIKVLNHKTLILENLNIEYSESKASLDDIELELKTYTYRNKTCLHDLIFWHKPDVTVNLNELDLIFSRSLNAGS